MLMVGSLLGLSLLFSSFAAVMFTVMVAVYQLVKLMRERAWGALFRCGLVGALPVVAAVWLGDALSYVDRGGSIVTLRVNPMATHRAPLVIFLGMGPMLIGAVAGGRAAVRKRGTSFGVVATMVAVSFFFYFFVDVRDHQDVYVGWRAGHLLFIAFSALVAYGLDQGWNQGGLWRRATVVTAVAVAGAALPTTIIDLYNTQDVSNRGQAPGFRWTLVLSQDEVAALEWIKRTTPRNARVQVEPYIRDAETWAYIPAFAERRMAAGLPISMVPLNTYQRASDRIRGIYRAVDAATAHQLAVASGVDYLVVGPPERQAYPGVQLILDSDPSLFPRVYRNPSVSVYLVSASLP